MSDRTVYAESESFKRGWVAGFYDALFDDGVQYLDDILRYGICSEAQLEFMAGYRYGRRLRNGTFSPKPHSQVSVLCQAA